MLGRMSPTKLRDITRKCPMPPLDVSRLLAFEIPDVDDRCEADGSVLYALGVGAGLAPDINELSLLFEDRLQLLPTMALVLGTRGFWPMLPGSGLDWRSILHGEQSLVLHRPLRLGESLRGSTRVVDIADKGEGRSALIRAEKTLHAAGEELVATALETWVVRGAGGFGGARDLTEAPVHVVGEGPADIDVSLPTALSQAATYRLTGDRNPLHVDVETARAAGFDRPILHGLSTLGVIGRAIIHGVCHGEASRLAGIHARFTAPVYPGETLRILIWTTAKQLSFRCHVIERDLLAVEGTAEVSAGN